MGEGYFAKRRRIKREIVRMNVPLIDRIKEALFTLALTVIAILILIMVIRGRINGAW